MGTEYHHSRRRTIALMIAALIACCGPVETAWSCSCHQSTAEEMYQNADAVLEGRVTRVSHGYLRAAWCQIRALFGSELSDYETACGVRVTVEVQEYWKGVSSHVIRVVTGRGGGDCGVPFENDQRYLLYLRKIQSDLFETNICMRPQPLDQAAEDLAVLGPTTAPSADK